MPKSWKFLLPNFIDSEVEENVENGEIQLASLINQLQNTNPMSNAEALQWASEVGDNLVRNEILTVDEIIRTVTAEDDNDDDTPVNPVKSSHSEAMTTLNTSLQWAEEQNFKAHEIMLLRYRAFELKIGTAAQKKSLTFLDTYYVHSLTNLVIMHVDIIFILYHVHSIYPYNISECLFCWKCHENVKAVQREWRRSFTTRTDWTKGLQYTRLTDKFAHA
ncbi:hypothetical protein AVEN_273933-1 [Araneus ventricosus]|uniref:Uncharacterized protein n=1 Tax=Araneus ventricosus TaxID=182803 RepID=A0A4Y2I1R3_ARAVE|nr:hypothetical protein AVEN_273933-1 [Araneus ventricosus]